MDDPVDDDGSSHHTDVGVPVQRNAPSEATPLEAFDVFALIVNKVIGTGIYTAPSTVLLLTGSKQLSLGLWAVGFFYTIMSTFIYLDYAAVFPYTGGEIVYIDEITSSNSPPENALFNNQIFGGGLANGGVNGGGAKGVAGNHRNGGNAPLRLRKRPGHGARVFCARIFGDGLMAYTAYAFLFISLFNSATNLQQIGREVLIGIHPLDDPNRDLLRFIGVVALTVICFIQLFSARAGRVLNGLFALIKIAFLFVLLCFGWHYIAVNGPAPNFEDKPNGISALGYAQALLIVLYSYEGWENANFVAGEISTKNPSTLRKGFIWAVVVVGVLYLALNATFLSAISYAQVNKAQADKQQFNYAALLSGNDEHAQRAWAIIIAISAAGNANTVTYTFTRVKQSIGRANILPWSSLWRQDYTPSARFAGDRYKTPLGGLLMEWITTVILISISAVIPGTIESVNLAGNLQTYAHCFVLIILGLGLFRLRSRETALNVHVPKSRFPRVSHWHWSFQSIFIALYALMNMFIIIINAISDSSAIDNPEAIFRGRWYPTVLFSILGLGMLYYYVVFAAWVPKPFYKFSLLKWVDTQARIRKEPAFDMGLEEVRRFGHRRSIFMELMAESRIQQSIYWFFGGRVHRSPVEALEDNWNRIKREIDSNWEKVKSVFVARPARMERGDGESSVEGHEMDDRE